MYGGTSYRSRAGRNFMKRQSKRRSTALWQSRMGPGGYNPNIRTGGYLGIERKYFDTVKTATALSASWAGGELDPTGDGLCQPTKGTGPTNRDGDHIVVKSIQVRGKVYIGAKSDQDDVKNPSSYCMLLVHDRQTNGAQLNAEEVMVATDPETMAYRNLQYSKRFKVLAARRGNLYETATIADGANTGSTTGNAHFVNWNIRCNIPVDFKGDAGTIADIVDNSFHIIAVSEVAATVYVQYHARVRFVG